MGSRRSAIVLFVGFLGFSCGLRAQRPGPTLDDVLQRLHANLKHYDSSLPSLFCDEHVVSKVAPGYSDENTIMDSVFHLKRIDNADHTETLAESREIKMVNGKPARSQTMRGFPSMLSGVFEGGLAIVSLDQKACMRYTLERVHNGRPYIVNFATALTPENQADCLLQEKSKGRVFIDPESMEITHLEMTAPHHVIIPGNEDEAPVMGKWIVTVDYAPVVLDGDTFWLPKTISSNDVGDWTTWSFQATYRNYHRMEVKSRILSGDGGVVQ